MDYEYNLTIVVAIFINQYDTLSFLLLQYRNISVFLPPILIELPAACLKEIAQSIRVELEPRFQFYMHSLVKENLLFWDSRVLKNINIPDKDSEESSPPSPQGHSLLILQPCQAQYLAVQSLIFGFGLFVTIPSIQNKV